MIPQTYRRQSRFAWMAASLVAVHLLGQLVAARWPVWANWLALQPDAAVRHGQLWRLFTGIFIPGAAALIPALALILFLIPFAADEERRSGPWELLWLYVIGGAGAGLMWAVLALVWDWHQPLYLAGAVSVLVVNRLTMGLRAPIRVPFEIPAWIPAIFYAGACIYQSSSGTVELSAQLCGALLGLMYSQFDWSLAATILKASDLARFRRFRAALRTERRPIPVKNDDVDEDSDERAPAKPAGDRGDFDARVDRVLAKISDQGPKSLTEEEIRLLLEASQRYRGRR
ncbi:MAG TPA: rhomboid family intramembrane serine protease [Planctomycetia bacterium]|nr:rhomboid family intramembrane serine protease [Planctomycetia bacterium]